MNATPRKLRRRSTRPFSILALEPRIMFDGAGAVEAAHAVADGGDGGDTATLVPAPVTLREADPAQNNGRKEVAFIDTAVADYQSLVDGVRAGVEVVLLDGGQSGLAQMALWAQDHYGYDAIHVLSHGAQGTVFLGGDTVTAATLGGSA